MNGNWTNNTRQCRCFENNSVEFLPDLDKNNKLFQQSFQNYLSIKIKSLERGTKIGGSWFYVDGCIIL